ncbi:uncharacterized protein LOC130649418 isoform X2 [Hydractinia symbiolongicarpus]|uniref:uncharacterized protein LOC130649418 isoform X2 n=1 Tax=Hydractinia symbiolongicarpus TaxID=13093 RepID=UPI00254D1B9E|nr:uncharacterized protein LOC130649418 isoform X2 [Hydractinia symbiolongicarpus]
MSFVLEIIENYVSVKKMAVEEADLPPPLEDLSESFHRLLKPKTTEYKREVNTKLNEYLEVTCDEENRKVKSIQKLMTKNSVKNSEISGLKKQQKNDTFCGFKKGFLLQEKLKPPATQTEKKEDAVIVKKKKENEEDKNVLPEVQKAMKSQVPLLQSQKWVTEDLLQKILSHPKLSKKFTDPRFSKAIQQLQTNPQHVMKMCQTNTELREFIQEFCAIMGEHFTGMADVQEKAAVFSSKSKKPHKQENSDVTVAYTRPSLSSDEDDKKMQKILADPEIVSILQAPEIQHLFTVIRSNPNEGPRILKTADSASRQKIRKLIDVGLLQFAIQ